MFNFQSIIKTRQISSKIFCKKYCVNEIFLYLCIVFETSKRFKDTKSSLIMSENNNKLPQILVKYGEKRKLAELMGTTYQTVQAALEGWYSSDFVLRIRKLALERGGREV